MRDAIAGFMFWAFVSLLAYFGLPLVVYGVAMFISWGAWWNPGAWTQEARVGAAVFWSAWAVVVTMAFIELS